MVSVPLSVSSDERDQRTFRPFCPRADTLVKSAIHERAIFTVIMKENQCHTLREYSTVDIPDRIKLLAVNICKIFQCS